MAELGCPIAGCGQRVGATESVGAGLQKCAKCRQRVYCCKACQVQHWKDGHKQECKELQMGAGAEAGVLSRPAQDELLAALLETNATGRDLTDSEFRWMDKTSLLFDAGHFSLVKAETEEGLKVLKQIRNDRPDIAVKIYFMLGHSLTESCQHKKGAQLLQKGRALAMKTGDRVDLGQICLSLGACHLRQGEYSEAIEALEQSRAITVERGEPQWEARVCNNLGLCYESMKLYEKATELFEFCLKIHWENDDLLQMGMLRCNLGRCQSQRGWHQRAVCSLKLAWLIMHKLQEPQKQALVALPLGTALWMKARAEHYQATAGVAAAEWEGASEACRETLVDADYWLRLALTKALELGIRTLKLQAQMHLACVTFFRGNAKDAVKMIGQHLNGWCDLGKAICAGCGQARGEKLGEKDFPMLTCAHCRVARLGRHMQAPAPCRAASWRCCVAWWLCCG